MVTLTLRLFNGDILDYTTDGIDKVKFIDHIDNIRNLVLRHLDLGNNEIVRFFHSDDEEDMISLYFHKLETDPIFKTKLSLFEHYSAYDSDNEGSFIRKMINNINNEEPFQIQNEESSQIQNEESSQIQTEKTIEQVTDSMNIIYSLISMFVPLPSVKEESRENIKNKLSDKNSMLYFLLYSEMLKQKVYTQDTTLYIFIDDVIKKDMFDASDALKNMTNNKEQCCIF